MACIIALFVHYGHFYGGYPLYMYRLPWLWYWGWLMVELFFMLSGFGISLGYEEKIAGRHICFFDFIKRRVSKIYPLYFTTLIMTTILQFLYWGKTGAILRYSNLDFYHLVLQVLLLQSGIVEVKDWPFFGTSWFISIIFICYIVFYIITHLGG